MGLNVRVDRLLPTTEQALELGELVIGERCDQRLIGRQHMGGPLLDELVTGEGERDVDAAVGCRVTGD